MSKSMQGIFKTKRISYLGVMKCCIQGCKKTWPSNSILGVTGLEEILEEKVVAMRVD